MQTMRLYVFPLFSSFVSMIALKNQRAKIKFNYAIVVVIVCVPLTPTAISYIGVTVKLAPGDNLFFLIVDSVVFCRPASWYLWYQAICGFSLPVALRSLFCCIF